MEGTRTCFDLCPFFGGLRKKLEYTIRKILMCASFGDFIKIKKKLKQLNCLPIEHPSHLGFEEFSPKD